MQSNISKSQSVFNKFGIQTYSEIIEPMLKKNNIDGSILFFGFKHLDNVLKCRLAFCSLDNKLEYETYLEFYFNDNPIEVIYHGKCNDNKRRKRRCTSFSTVKYLHGLTQLDIDNLVDSLLQKR